MIFKIVQHFSKREKSFTTNYCISGLSTIFTLHLLQAYQVRIDVQENQESFKEEIYGTASQQDRTSWTRRHSTHQ